MRKIVTGIVQKITIRFGSIADMDRMRRAARIEGISRNTFMVRAILKESSRVIETASTASDKETLLEKGA